MFKCVKVQGCYFHLKKSIWKKIQNPGLTELYVDECKPNYKLRMKMLAALAFVPVVDVEKAFD